MGDIMDVKSPQMNVTTFDAIQTVNYSPRAGGSTSIEHFSWQDTKQATVLEHEGCCWEVQEVHDSQESSSSSSKSLLYVTFRYKMSFK